LATCVLKGSSPAGEKKKAACRRKQKKQMSYEMMEALLVQKISTIRRSEAMIARSLRSASGGSNVMYLTAAQQRMYSEIEQVEQLLSAMDAAPSYEGGSVPALHQVDVAAQMSPSAWV
jgi:hypothetical protein